MRALLIIDDDLSNSEQFGDFRIESASASFDERWLQNLIFSRPELLPTEEIAPGSGQFIPICRELPLLGAGSARFLDIFGVTSSGRVVLVECKLWRNPQSRREVVAQGLEYAALLQGLSYGDLSSLVARRVESGGAGRSDNLLYEEARRRGALDCSEAVFVDRVSSSLARGEFEVVIAGDGIRSDLQSIASFIQNQTGAASRISLVEFQLWRGPGSQVFVLPTVPLRTEVVEHRVIFDSNGQPVSHERVDESTAILEEIDPDREAERRQNRAFWEDFISSLHLDHPDQPAPVHGGNNWVKLPLPPPATHLTAYRTKQGQTGVFCLLLGDEGESAFRTLEADRTSLSREMGFDIKFKAPDDPGGRPGQYQISTSVGGLGGSDSDASQRDWLQRAVNAFVAALRPRIRKMSPGA